MNDLSTPAVIAICAVAAVVIILLIPHRYRPWWERPRDWEDR